MSRRALAVIVSLLLALAAGALAAPEPAPVPRPPPAPGHRAAAAVKTSCQTCHADADLFAAEQVAIVGAMADDVHAAAGIGCQDCHGGDPDPRLADDPDRAMDAAGANGFRGAPTRAAIPDLCGRCHSDAEYMKRFAPGLRVDQLQEYRTSRHGQLLAQGDTKVATCVDCHGAHGIKAPTSSGSPVHPTRVAETCARCHADATRMASYHLPDGAPLPTDQYDSWRSSMHANALLKKGDLSAPTCNDCHGNHGATPPGLGSISFVCGQCHGREAELFRQSKKSQAFIDHEALLADAGADGCAACHSAPEPQAALTGLRHFGECTTCHGNHAIVAPRVTMLAPLTAGIPCSVCHEPGGAGEAVVAEPPGRRQHYVQLRDQLLAEAARRGLTGDARFDWLIDQVQTLPTHNDLEENGTRHLRPEFARLFSKFRLGKTTTGWRDPGSGRVVRHRLRQCGDCHGGEDTSGGLAAATSFRDELQRLTALIGRAERIVLAARRGGVPVGDALRHIDAAVDSQIQLQVLVHTFDPDGAFAVEQREGIAHASAALTAGQNALDELRFRRQGLGVALSVIALALIGLALKIRQLPPAD